MSTFKFINFNIILIEILTKRDDTDFPHYDFDNIKIDDDCYVKKPGSLNFTFDWSCNFKCPSLMIRYYNVFDEVKRN